MLKSIIHSVSRDGVGISLSTLLPTSVIPSISNLFRKEKSEISSGTGALSDQIMSVLSDIRDELVEVGERLGDIDNESFKEYKEVIERLSEYSSQIGQVSEFSREELKEIVFLLNSLEEIQDRLSEIQDKELKKQIEVLESKVGRNIEKLVPAEESIAEKLNVIDPRKWMGSVLESLEKMPIAEEVSTAVASSLPFGQVLLGIQSLLGLSSPIELMAKVVDKLSVLPSLLGKGFKKLGSGISNVARLIRSGFGDLLGSLSSLFLPMKFIMKGILKYVKLSYLKQLKDKIFGFSKNIVSSLTSNVFGKGLSRLGGVLGGAGSIASKVLSKSMGSIVNKVKSLTNIFSKGGSKATNVFAKDVGVKSARSTISNIVSKIFSKPADIVGSSTKNVISKVLSKSTSVIGKVKPLAGVLGRLPSLASKSLPIVASAIELGGLFKGVKEKGTSKAITDFVFGEKEEPVTSRVTSGVLRGATIGSAVGSVVPGIGTLVGGLVGGGVGTVTSLIGQKRVSNFISSIKNLFAKDKAMQQSKSKVSALVESQRSSEVLMINELKKIQNNISATASSGLAPTMVSDGTGTDATKIPVVVDDVGIVLLGAGLL